MTANPYSPVRYLAILCLMIFSSATKSDAGAYKLVFAEEFSGAVIDTSVWGFENGLVRNNEKQYYTQRSQNARIENGSLVIEALKENYQGSFYTAASLETRNKREWTYGRIEVMARIPTGKGMWPAIWTLGPEKYGWPKQGEIDIMENVGFDPTYIHGTVHTGAYNHVLNTHKGGKTSIAKVWEKPHVYAVEWSATRIDFFVDTLKYFTFEKPANATLDQWPFDFPNYIKLNVSVGGNWGGAQGVDDTVFPQRMTVDYVRVYQWKDDAVPVLLLKPGKTRLNANLFYGIQPYGLTFGTQGVLANGQRRLIQIRR